MGSMTIRNIDDDVKTALRLRAARRGVSMEHEVRDILREAVREPGSRRLTDQERAEKVARLLSYAQPPLEPFDLKAFSDDLSDGVE